MASENPGSGAATKRIAGSSHEVEVHDMQKSDVASKAKYYGVRSVPAVVIDGKLASCCPGRGPEERVLRELKPFVRDETQKRTPVARSHPKRRAGQTTFVMLPTKR